MLANRLEAGCAVEAAPLVLPKREVCCGCVVVVVLNRVLPDRGVGVAVEAPNREGVAGLLWPTLENRPDMATEIIGKSLQSARSELRNAVFGHV